MKRGVTILPVVARELLVASRRKQTYGMRMALAVIAVLATTVTTVGMEFFDAPPIKGPQLFQLLSFVAYACGVMAATGTLDAISIEKREGTLGLLFLTRLRSFDIVLGKLAPAALLSLYGLVSIIPVMAVPMAMGGVSLTELVRGGLALTTVILWSLCLGLLISALVRNSARAMTGLGVGLALWAFGAADIITNSPLQAKAPEFFAFILLFNPKYLLNMSSGAAVGLTSNMFWSSWAMHVTMIIAFLWAACASLPHTWQDKPGGKKFNSFRERLLEWRFGKAPSRLRLRKRLLDVNAVFWLRSRDIVSASGFLIVILLLGLAALLLGVWKFKAGPGGATGPLVLFGIGWIFTLMSLSFAFIATVPGAMGQSLAEDRQSGALDLLVATPLKVQEIVKGHWLATARKLSLPLIPLLLIGVLVYNWFLAMYLIEERQELKVIELLTFGLQNAFSYSPTQDNEEAVPTMIVAGGLLLAPIAIFAMGWTGLWLGLRVQQAKNVPGLSFPMVIMPPWAIFLPIRGVILYCNSRFGWTIPENIYTWVVLWVVIAAAYMLTLGFLLRHKVLKGFRGMATDRFTNIETSKWAKFIGVRAKT